MTVVESGIEVFTVVQESGQDLDDYYKVFETQVDTIDMQGDTDGYHSLVYQLHLEALPTSKLLMRLCGSVSHRPTRRRILETKALNRISAIAPP